MIFPKNTDENVNESRTYTKKRSSTKEFNIVPVSDACTCLSREEMLKAKT